MADLVALTAHLPTLDLAPGEALVAEGTRTGSVFVLEHGHLEVTRQGQRIAVITQPGSLVGEVAVLAGGDHSATVTAVEASRVRVARDGTAFLLSDPEVTLRVATELAERLQGLVAYLADLKQQYGDAPGLTMVGDVLARLADRKGPPPSPGSAREPEPPY